MPIQSTEPTKLEMPCFWCPFLMCLVCATWTLVSGTRFWYRKLERRTWVVWHPCNGLLQRKLYIVAVRAVVWASEPCWVLIVICYAYKLCIRLSSLVCSVLFISFCYIIHRCVEKLEWWSVWSIQILVCHTDCILLCCTSDSVSTPKKLVVDTTSVWLVAFYA